MNVAMFICCKQDWENMSNENRFVCYNKEIGFTFQTIVRVQVPVTKLQGYFVPA